MCKLSGWTTAGRWWPGLVKSQAPSSGGLAMATSPYPHLDEIVWRLRQLPEIEALLDYGYNGEPLIQPPPISVAGLTDMGLIIQLQAHTAAYFRRLAYVAGGSAVAVRAMRTI